MIKTLSFFITQRHFDKMLIFKKTNKTMLVCFVTMKFFYELTKTRKFDDQFH